MQMIRNVTQGSMTRLILDRADKANALTQAMLDALDQAVSEAQSPVLVLSGAGRCFSAGADLAEVEAGLATSPVWERLSARIAAYPGLTIAALNGTAAGGSLGMVLACDLRICVPDARFFYPVMRLGHLPQPSDPARLCALVGPARAKLLLMAGQRWSAEQALTFGLVDDVVHPDALDTTVAALAADALGADPGHVAAIKSLISRRDSRRDV